MNWEAFFLVLLIFFSLGIGAFGMVIVDVDPKWGLGFVAIAIVGIALFVGFLVG